MDGTERPLAKRVSDGGHSAPSQTSRSDSSDATSSGTGGVFKTSRLAQMGIANSPYAERKGEASLMTLEQAAVEARVSVRTLARYRKSKALEVTKVGRRVLCTLEAIQRAMIRRSVQQLWRDITDPSRESDTLSNWLRDVQSLAETSPNYESPEVHRAYTNEVTARFPHATVGNYTVAHLAGITAALAKRDLRLESAQHLLTFPPDTPVIVALRGLHARFGV
jgi:hypothetical protein